MPRQSYLPWRQRQRAVRVRWKLRPGCNWVMIRIMIRVKGRVRGREMVPLVVKMEVEVEVKIAIARVEVDYRRIKWRMMTGRMTRMRTEGVSRRQRQGRTGGGGSSQIRVRPRLRASRGSRPPHRAVIGIGIIIHT